MIELENKTIWAQNEGLLPIKLDPTTGAEKYIMLNGGLHDFCIDFSREDLSKKDSFSAAWSTNTKNYISIKDNFVHVFNWVLDSHSKLPIDVVQKKFDQFVGILKQNTYKTDEDITPYVLNYFRQMRNLTCESHEPIEALGLLYKLLISINQDIKTIDCNEWDIPDVVLPNQFEEFVNSFKSGVRGIMPNLDYILRHCSGPIFQEAHREVSFFYPQRDLFGGVSSQLSFATPRDAYSSIHYTPQYIARSIVENVISQLDLNKPFLRILDPTCGSGAFLVEILKQLRELDYRGQLNIEGWDISQSAVNTTRFLLKYEQKKLWGNRLTYQILKVEDSLQQKWRYDYDVILMNPPFLSWELLKDSGQRDAVESILADIDLKRRPNQAAAFFYKAIQSLGDNGVIGTILPSSILLFDIYNDLRSKVLNQISLCVVARLGNFVFEDALTDVSFIIGKVSQIHTIPPKAIWCKNEKGAAYEVLKGWRKLKYTNSSYRSEQNYSIHTPATFPIIKSSWNVMPMKEEEFLTKLTSWVKMGKLCPLGKIFTIWQGLLSGRKNIFDIDRTIYNQLSEYEKRFYRPLIHSGSINLGQISTDKYIWFPYDEHGLMIHSEDELSELYFTWNHLSNYKAVLTTRKSVKNWWELTRPRTWQFENQFRLYSHRFGNHNSFGIGSREDYVIEEGNAFSLNKKNYNHDDYFFYLSLFSSDIFERMLSIYSKRIMSGYDLGKIQIQEIPIVDINDNVRSLPQYQQLVKIGRLLTKGEAYMADLIDESLVVFYPTL